MERHTVLAIDVCRGDAFLKDSIVLLSSDGSLTVISIDFEGHERVIRRTVLAEVKLIVLTSCRTLKSFQVTSNEVSFAVGGVEKIRILRYKTYLRRDMIVYVASFKC